MLVPAMKFWGECNRECESVRSAECPQEVSQKSVYPPPISKL